MNFLNLGLGELLGLIGVISAGVVALYLLDKSKKRLSVSTLRFCTPATARTDLKHRRKIQQPLSLLLQLLSLILLLIAIAGPQFGIFDGPGRDHVLVLDTSAWMGSTTQQGTLLDQAKANAWLDARMAQAPIADANDALYQYEAARDYDASSGLEQISARVLAINNADDERNPPELGLMDAAMQRVARGRAVWVPASPQTVGHATLGSPRWWKDELAAELAQL